MWALTECQNRMTGLRQMPNIKPEPLSCTLEIKSSGCNYQFWISCNQFRRFYDPTTILPMLCSPHLNTLTYIMLIVPCSRLQRPSPSKKNDNSTTLPQCRCSAHPTWPFQLPRDIMWGLSSHCCVSHRCRPPGPGSSLFYLLPSKTNDNSTTLPQRRCSAHPTWRPTRGRQAVTVLSGNYTKRLKSSSSSS